MKKYWFEIMVFLVVAFCAFFAAYIGLALCWYDLGAIVAACAIGCVVLHHVRRVEEKVDDLLSRLPPKEDAGKEPEGK